MNVLNIQIRGDFGSRHVHIMRRCRKLTLMVVMLGLGVFGARSIQAVDMSVIWQMTYGAWGLNPNADADGDGLSNLQESLAGTNPFDPASHTAMTLKRTATNVVLNIPGIRGKQYQWESIQDGGAGAGLGTNWIVEATEVSRSGGMATLTNIWGQGSKYFRVLISDLDSDEDGLKDVEEYQVGLDPFNPVSNGKLNILGQPLNDADFVRDYILAAPNVVTIEATIPAVTQPDPGQPPVTEGLFTIRRAGLLHLPLAVTLALGGGGPEYATEGVDYGVMPRLITFPAGVTSHLLTLTPLENPNRMVPVLAMMLVAPGAGYTAGFPSNASIVVKPSPTSQGFGLIGEYFNGSSTNHADAANFDPARLALTQLDPTVDFVWGTTLTPITNDGSYTIRWSGFVQPEFSETYVFTATTDDGVRLWIEDQLVVDNWTPQTAIAWTGASELQAGVRYRIRLEYFNAGGGAEAHLSWASPRQPAQIIPASRLYPAFTDTFPPVIISPQTAVAFHGLPFTYAVVAAGGDEGPITCTTSLLPPGLTFNAATGIIGGTPTLLGVFQITLTASNAVGSSGSVLHLKVIAPDTVLSGQVWREVWTSVPGRNIGDIPLSTAPTLITALKMLEGMTNYGDNYGERLRGHFTPTVTGNYYFWIAGSDSAELWISDDDEPVNKLRRARVLPNANPAGNPANGTASRQWNLQPSQKSQWLALVAGQPYYFEILHKAGTGRNDNWAVGWLQDPTGTNTLPGGVVPGSMLTGYVDPPPSTNVSTLFIASLRAQGNTSTAVGGATLRLSANSTQARLEFSYSGLSSPMTGAHIHSDPFRNKASQIVFDVGTATPETNGSYLWTIGPVGMLSAAEVVEILREGRLRLNIHSVNFPAGELDGHFSLALGTRSFTPPPPAPGWADDHTDANAASRFLTQATFGPTPSEIARVQAMGYQAWLDDQFAQPVTKLLPNTLAKATRYPAFPDASEVAIFAWWEQSVTAPDQLRQRVAFALSEVLVVSEFGVLSSSGLSHYYDTLLVHSFGNFRDALKAVTLNPAMGNYLDMRHNDKANPSLGTLPNENYAREFMQLFSVGLMRLWPDGTLVLDSQDEPVPTYNQDVVMGVARVFTGWNYYQPNQGNGRLPVEWSPAVNWTNPMVLVPSHHELGTKLLLNNVVLPAATGSQSNSASASFDAYCANDFEALLDTVCNHPNVGPFICRQLIQRLVTSHPSRDYLHRVVQTFNDNGAGVRGDLQAVVRAILLDYEARSSTMINQPTFGKQREPLLRVTAPARAFFSASTGGTYSQSGGQTLTLTTTNAHRLATLDAVVVEFTDSSGSPAPSEHTYFVTVTGPQTFTVPSSEIVAGTYSQAGNTITVTAPEHGLAAGNSVYLTFSTGGATNGIYSVTDASSNSVFSVATPDAAELSGECVLGKLPGGYTVTAGTTNIITVCMRADHWLNPDDSVQLNFLAGPASSGTYVVGSVPNARSFTVTTTGLTAVGPNGLAVDVYPLTPPPLFRSGTAIVNGSTWTIDRTDNTLSQTPLRSPTVFNYFFPDYQFPGVLTAAGLTTPEFQLTSETAVLAQMNFLRAGLLNSDPNTNGLSSFPSGLGAIRLDVGPWMTTGYTAGSSEVEALVDEFNTLLVSGRLSAAARSEIVNYVSNPANLPIDSPPTFKQMSDRVQAAAYLILVSPEFTIQK